MYLLLVQFLCQPVVAVHIELEPEWSPGGNAKVAQAKRFVDEVEVIVKAFARIILEKGFSGLLVMPGLISRAGFHGREDMNRAGLFATLFDDVLDPGLFTERIELTNELDLSTVLLGDTLSILPDFFLKRFGELEVVEYFDLTGFVRIVLFIPAVELLGIQGQVL